MKTPDEIKKGIEECTRRRYGRECDVCPFHDYEYCNFELEKNALAYIQQLEKQIGELTEKVAQLEAAQPKWISVDERLPEKHGQDCVCLFNQHGADKSILFPLVFTWYAYGHNGYVNGPHFSDDGLDGLKVYYWMPLPDPPQEKP